MNCADEWAGVVKSKKRCSIFFNCFGVNNRLFRILRILRIAEWLGVSKKRRLQSVKYLRWGHVGRSVSLSGEVGNWFDAVVHRVASNRRKCVAFSRFLAYNKFYNWLYLKAMRAWNMPGVRVFRQETIFECPFRDLNTCRRSSLFG